MEKIDFLWFSEEKKGFVMGQGTGKVGGHQPSTSELKPAEVVQGELGGRSVHLIVTPSVRGKVLGEVKDQSINVVKRLWKRGAELEKRKLETLSVDEREILSAYLELKKRHTHIVQRTQGVGIFSRIREAIAGVRKRSAAHELEKFFGAKVPEIMVLKDIDKRISPFMGEGVTDSAKRVGVQALLKGAKLLEQAVSRGVFTSQQDVSLHLYEATFLRQKARVLQKQESAAKSQLPATPGPIARLVAGVKNWWIEQKASRACSSLLKTKPLNYDGLVKTKPLNYDGLVLNIITHIPEDRAVAKAYFSLIRDRFKYLVDNPQEFNLLVDNLDRLSEITDELLFDPDKGIDPQWYKLVEEASKIVDSFGGYDRINVETKFRPHFRKFLFSLFNPPSLTTQMEHPEEVEQQGELQADVTLELISGEKKTIPKADINRWALAHDCGSLSIKNTFGRVGDKEVTIDGNTLGVAPAGGDDSKGLARVYLLSQKLVEAFLKKNPGAELERVQRMVDELLLREAIDYSTFQKITPFANNICFVGASASPQSKHEFTVEQGKIVCSRKDVLTFKDFQDLEGKVTATKNVEFKVEITLEDGSSRSWVEELKILPDEAEKPA